MKIGFAADGRHTYTIPIAANACNHALHQMLHLGVIGAAKAQRVHVRHRPRAHGEYVTQDAAYASRRALIGFDIAGVVVRLHLEDRRLPVTNVDHASIFSRAANHPRGLGRQFFQMDARAFIAAMLRPHHRENAKLDQIGLAPHCIQDALIFFLGKAMVGDDLRGDLGGSLGHARRFSVACRL